MTIFAAAFIGSDLLSENPLAIIPVNIMAYKSQHDTFLILGARHIWFLNIALFVVLITLSIIILVRTKNSKLQACPSPTKELTTKLIHLEALNHLAEMTNSFQPEQIMASFMDVLSKYFQSEAYLIMLYDELEDFLKLSCQKGFAPSLDYFSCNLTQGTLGKAASASQPLAFVWDADPNLKRCQINNKFQGGLAIPIRIADQLLGVFSIISQEKTVFEQEEIIILSILAERLSMALYNARLFRLSKDQASECFKLVQDLTDLMEVADAVQGSLKQEEILRTITEKCYQRFNAHTCQINLINKEENWLEIAAFKGFAPRLTGRIHKDVYRYSSQCPVLMGDKARVFSASDSCPYFHGRDTIRTYMCAPLRVVGDTFGVIHLTSIEDCIFPDHDLNLLSSFAKEAGLAVQRGRLYEQLAQEKERAEQANLLKSEFLATISHELRTPLNSIIGYTQCILDGVDGSINAEQATDLTRVLNNAEKLLRLINNILDLSRLELDFTEINYERLDIDLLIDEAINTIQPLADAHKLKINKDLCFIPSVVYGDWFRLQQILNNLLSNAVKFTPQGSINIRTDLNINPGYLTFIIADTGVGFPREAQEYIFERFRQADGSITRQYGGSGLGLSICKNLVQLMGGEIWAHSIPGQGSSFYFTLPLHSDLHC